LFEGGVGGEESSEDDLLFDSALERESKEPLEPETEFDPILPPPPPPPPPILDPEEEIEPPLLEKLVELIVGLIRFPIELRPKSESGSGQ